MGREQSTVRGRRLRNRFFGGEFLHFFHQGIDNLSFGDFADDFAAFKD
jgi:hypothetical protein